MSETKPGYKSTEFWSAIPGAAALIELCRDMAQAWPDPSNGQAVLIALPVIGAATCLVWYTAKRTELKLEAQADA